MSKTWPWVKSGVGGRRERRERRVGEREGGWERRVGGREAGAEEGRVWESER